MRSRYSLAALVLFGVVLVHPGRVLAGPPDPFTSIVPQCLTAFPAGDMPVTALVPDASRAPVPGSNVVLDFSACPAFTLCTPKQSDPYSWNPATRQVSALTDALGRVTFPLRAGGVCDTAHGVSVLASGVFLAGRTMA